MHLLGGFPILVAALGGNGGVRPPLRRAARGRSVLEPGSMGETRALFKSDVADPRVVLAADLINAAPDAVGSEVSAGLSDVAEIPVQTVELLSLCFDGNHGSGGVPRLSIGSQII